MIGFRHTLVGQKKDTLPTDLVGYYPFNGNANDESINDNNGVVNNAALATDRFGNSDSAYAFNKVDTNIDIPNAIDVNDPTTGSFAISIWVYANEINTGSSIILANEGGGQGYVLNSVDAGSGTTLFWRMRSGGTSFIVETSQPEQVGSWTNYIINVDKATNTATAYYNGASDGSVDVSAMGDISSGNTLSVGSNVAKSAGFYNGRIDDIRIYSRILTLDEIAAIQSATDSLPQLPTSPAPAPAPAALPTNDISLFTNGLYNFTGNIQKNTINNKYSSVYDQGVSHYSLGDLHNVLVDVYTDAFATLEASRVAMAADAVNDYSFTNPSSGYTNTGRLVVIATKVDHSSNYQPLALVVRYSDDDGVSWSSEYTIPGIIVYTALNTNSNIIEQSGSLYCPFYEADRVSSGVVNLKCMRSDDNGATWAVISTIDTNMFSVTGEPINETSMMFLDNTTILAMTRVNGKSYYNQYISVDSGLNWTKQGNTSFGDTWPDNNTSSAYVHLIRLGKFNLNGKTVIASYYFNRYGGVVYGDSPFYVTYALASNFTGQGVNAWLSDERKEIVTSRNPYSNLDGYPAILHDNNDINAAIRIFDDRDNGSQNKTDIFYVRIDMQDTQWLYDLLV